MSDDISKLRGMTSNLFALIDKFAALPVTENGADVLSKIAKKAGQIQNFASKLAKVEEGSR